MSVVRRVARVRTTLAESMDLAVVAKQCPSFARFQTSLETALAAAGVLPA